MALSPVWPCSSTFTAASNNWPASTSDTTISMRTRGTNSVRSSLMECLPDSDAVGG